MRLFLIIIFNLIITNANAESYENFKKDFNKALNENFTEKELNSFFREYSSFISPHSDVTQFRSGLRGETIEQFPLSDFKLERLYTENISKLLNSKNQNHRILAYITIAGAGDKSQENVLLSKIAEETDEGCLIWAGMALLHLRTTHTTELFDFLVKHEDFGDAHMLPLFISLDSSSLRQTAYSRINSNETKAKILAVQVLAYTGYNAKTADLIRSAIRDWPFEQKGYAVFAAKELGVGNLLELLRPLLDSCQTRELALQALANSTTVADQQYLKDLITTEKHPSEELLNSLSYSQIPENVRYWLTLLSTSPLPEKYYFSIFDQKILFKDAMLNDVHRALETIEDNEILSTLLRVLKDRTDKRSTDILLTLLEHKNSDVRYWAAITLKGNQSARLKTLIPQLLADKSKRVVSLTDLAIENNLDNLQPTFEEIYANNKHNDWTRSSIEYLSTFPKPVHKDIFRNILQSKSEQDFTAEGFKPEDFFMKRSAAIGLARLKDESSVDLIIEACREECKNSDYNSLVYLQALNMIKTTKAKREIEKYRDSKDNIVRESATKMLKDW